VDHAIATLDVVIQHLQGFIAAANEILLHLHLHIGARQPVAQSLAIAAKLRTHRGEEQFYLSHTSAIGNDPSRQADRQKPLNQDPEPLVCTSVGNARQLWQHESLIAMGVTNPTLNCQHDDSSAELSIIAWEAWN
jgi:hypothetical protein